MKKLIIVILISVVFFIVVFVGNGIEKIDIIFVDLDNDDNGYILWEEVDDDEIYVYFFKIDINLDM